MYRSPLLYPVLHVHTNKTSESRPYSNDRGGAHLGYSYFLQRCEYLRLQHSPPDANLPGVTHDAPLQSYSVQDQPRSQYEKRHTGFNNTKRVLYEISACVVCVCECVFVKLRITAQSGPVILVILCHSH